MRTAVLFSLTISKCFNATCYWANFKSGKGCVFTYDVVGSYEKLKSPSPLLLPAQDAITPLSEPEAVDLVNTVFASATKRDIYIGDKLEIMILKADDIRTEVMELRKD
ncbi:unnamed protein product [Brassica napus]|uniref:(rape) hypothetical protein n=1 Tax=Brassica napus TaxID=3708 RepID=A0A817A1C4_BRANA|nr:unnamed protein product [Brassica napus]